MPTNKEDDNGAQYLPHDDNDSEVQGVRDLTTRQSTREESIWRQWLQSMASDSESALAAAMAYREMSGEQRTALLASLLESVAELGIPLVAVVAPLLAVEDDPERREHLESALLSVSEETFDSLPLARPQALWNVPNHWRMAHDSSERLLVFVLPLYLEFVQVLAVEVKNGALGNVRHDPILNREQAPQSGQLLDGLTLEDVPLSSAVDILAQCIVTSHRKQIPIPDAVRVMTDWLNPAAETPAPTTAQNQLVIEKGE